MSVSNPQKALVAAGLVGFLCLGPAPQDPSPSIDVTIEEGTNFAVALSPDGSELVFDLQGTLWSLPAEGGEGRALTDGLGDDRLPDYSPDGSRIVFQSYRAGSWDLWAIGSDGQGLAPLTEGPSDDREPVWSPDGSRVAFSSDRAGHYDIWVLNVASGQVTPLTTNEREAYMPTWSPDGTTIAYLSDGETPGTSELWRIDAQGGQGVRLASFEGKAASPSWSRDGRQLALQLLEERAYELAGWRFSEGVASDLLVLPARGGDSTKRTSGEDVFPFRAQWTSGGDLLYTSDGRIRRLPAGEVTPHPIPFSVKVTLNRPPYARRAPSFPSGRLPVRGIVAPVLSSDGQHLAFSALGDVWIARADGSDPMLLTRDGYVDSDPSWSPDGRDIVFASDRAGSMDLWRKKSDAAPGGEVIQLTNLPGAESSPAWSPDGQWIAFIDQNHDLYVIPAEGGSPRLIRRSERWAGAASWSSDSVHLVLMDLGKSSNRFREGANRMVVVSKDSGEERLIQFAGELADKSVGTRAGDGPSWSPDGRFLAFALDGALFVLPVSPDGEATGEPRRVFDSPIHFPTWAPDSRSILFLAADKLMRADIDGARATEVALDLSYRVPAPAGLMLIRNARVIDGTGAEPQEGVDILIEEGRIRSVSPTGTEHIPDIPVIDATGKTVIPGLIDMHVHMTLPDFGSRQGRLWLAFGVTSVRSTGGPIYRILEEQESIEAGRRLGPRIFTTGFVFDGARVYYAEYLAIDTEEELQRELQRAFTLNYDLIKTYVRLPDLLQRRAIEEAHQRGVFVTSHEVYPAVALGVDGVEHLRGTSRRGFSPKITDLRRTYRDVIDLVSRSGVYLSPTILIEGGFQLARARDSDLLNDARLVALLPSWALDAARRAPIGDATEREAVMSPIFETLRAISSAGGRLVAGTDAPIVPYGLGLVLEVEQMSEAGLGPLQAIHAATGEAAEALGVSSELGTIRSGRLADLVILEGNPVDDIRNLRRVDSVISRGRLLKVAHLLEVQP